MGYRPHGRAAVDRSDPRAWATCQRCGLLYNLHRLQWQFDYRGQQLRNLQLLVCDRCLDVPQPQLRPIILPPDPVPVRNARPEPYTIDETSWRVTEAGDRRVTEAGDSRVVMPDGDDMLDEGLF